MAPRLYVNIDHVATLRQQRGTKYPDPVVAASLCELAGAEGITAHLREDRRHIQDRDIRLLRETVSGVFNLEMAATDEMLAIALGVRPDFCTLVPEKRAERTTEGGLDVSAGGGTLERVIGKLREAEIGVSLFIDPDPGDRRTRARAGGRDRRAAHGRLLPGGGPRPARSGGRARAGASHGGGPRGGRARLAGSARGMGWIT